MPNFASGLLGDCDQARQEQGEWVSHLSGVACWPGRDAVLLLALDHLGSLRQKEGALKNE